MICRLPGWQEYSAVWDPAEQAWTWSGTYRSALVVPLEPTACRPPTVQLQVYLVCIGRNNPVAIGIDAQDPDTYDETTVGQIDLTDRPRDTWLSVSIPLEWTGIEPRFLLSSLWAEAGGYDSVALRLRFPDCPGSLLPPQSTGAERAIEAAICVRFEAIPIPLRNLWNVERIPCAFLPHVAWGLSVDEWGRSANSRYDSDGWTVERRRAVVASAILDQRRKATKGAILRMLAAAGFPDAVITEGVTDRLYGDGSLYGESGVVYGAQEGWAKYTVHIPHDLSPEQEAQAIRLLQYIAPARCKLHSLTWGEPPPPPEE